MEVQVISSRWIDRDDDGATVGRHSRGALVEVSKDVGEKGIELGYFRSADQASEELPPPNAPVAPVYPTQPDGTEIRQDADGNDLNLNDQTGPDVETFEASRHDAADAKGAELGISFPSGTTIAAKVEAINAFLAAQTSDAPASTEDISDLSDADLMARGEVAGLSEGEMVELSHDELVLRVAEAVNARSADPLEQAAQAEPAPASTEE